VRAFESLKGRREFTLVMRKGRVAPTKALMVYGLTPRGRDRGARPKVGIVVTKKVGNAVVRNLVRRRCKAIFERLSLGTAPRWYLVHCKPEAGRAPFAELAEQLAPAVARVGATP
jgi:ribonuclease P protein component